MFEHSPKEIFINKNTINTKIKMKSFAFCLFLVYFGTLVWDRSFFGRLQFMNYLTSHAGMTRTSRTFLSQISTFSLVLNIFKPSEKVYLNQGKTNDMFITS